LHRSLSIEPPVSHPHPSIPRTPLGRAAQWINAHWRRPLEVSVEQLALAASLYWLVFANRVFFGRILDGAVDNASWAFALTLAIIIFALHFAFLLAVLNRWTARPLLALLIVIGAVASFYIEHFGAYIDVPMIHNVLATNFGEARELLTWALAVHLLVYACVPLLVLSRVRIVRKPMLEAAAYRSLTLVGAVALMCGAAFLSFKPLASVMRNHKELRYTVTPINVVWATGAALLQHPNVDRGSRMAVAEDAAQVSHAGVGDRPRLLVLVVGETARAANWGLNGYARDTTPELGRLPVINFRDVTACGTSTEVSLPCMFSLVGRRKYDQARIRRSESVLHVLARAGIAVSWIDNQSGCKGVCDGLPTLIASAVAGRACDDDCLDDSLVDALDRQVEGARAGTQVIVLHMIGAHGPAYFRRYPSKWARFAPACAENDLLRCDPTAVVNAYDNALAYTDHVLAAMIEHLSSHTGRLDAALIYVSDHGESLGEKGLFLHGIPYQIAPEEQLKVPMVMWMSPGFSDALQVDHDCLKERARRPASHDHLAHTVLGLLDVRTRDYVEDLDLTAACRRPAATRARIQGVQSAGAGY
jgi:lipid A ethanolaminephosphotransferase